MDFRAEQVWGSKGVQDKCARRRYRPALLYTIALLAFLQLSCTNDMKDISQFERRTPPDQELTDARIWRSEHGRLQLELDAPIIRQYRRPDTRTHYPKGVALRFYDDNHNLKTTIRADQATSFDDKNILRANGNVVVIDYSNGDTVYLEDIIWKSNEDLIYSNHPVRSVNAGRVTYGDGFISDENMSNLRIRHQRGTIEIED